MPPPRPAVADVASTPYTLDEVGATLNLILAVLRTQGIIEA
jgi:hypothetical protein